VNCNTSLEYVNYGGDHQKTLNCQDFVLRLLDVMNLKLQWDKDADIQRFVKRLRKNGKCSMKRFENRTDLEEYIHEIALDNPQFITGSEYRLLRASAEAMELKFYKYKERLLDSESTIERCEWEMKMLLNSRVLNPQEQKELQTLQKSKTKAEKERDRSQTMCKRYSIA
jgi:hypothetical protein